MATQRHAGMIQSTAPLSPQRPEKIHALTSLRFFAALFVVLYHTLWTVVPTLTRESAIGRVLSLGYVSVSFFYLLSGYILGMVYLSSGRPLNRRNFYAARFARVYPLYFLTLLLDTPDLLLNRVQLYGGFGGAARTARTFLIQIVMLQAWIPQLRGIDPPNWSLSAETIFYIIFPFIGIAIWKLKSWRLWTWTILIWVGGQLIIDLITPHVPKLLIWYNPVLHISTFALGIFLARWQCLQRERRGRSSRRASSVPLTLALAFFGFACVVYWQDLIPEGNIRDGILAPVFFCIIWAFSANWSLPAKLLSARWLVVLGEASYGLYLIHIPVYHLWEHAHWESIPALYLVYLAVSIGLSVLSFYYVETPSRRWILQKLQSRPKETMEAASDAQ